MTQLSHPKNKCEADFVKWTISKVCSLLNLRYRITFELTFEKFIKAVTLHRRRSCTSWKVNTIVTRARSACSLCSRKIST